MGLAIALENLGDAAPGEESPAAGGDSGAASWRYAAYRSWSVMSMSTMTYAFGMWPVQHAQPDQPADGDPCLGPRESGGCGHLLRRWPVTLGRA